MLLVISDTNADYADLLRTGKEEPKYRQWDPTRLFEYEKAKKAGVVLICRYMTPESIQYTQAQMDDADRTDGLKFWNAIKTSIGTLSDVMLLEEQHRLRVELAASKQTANESFSAFAIRTAKLGELAVSLGVVFSWDAIESQIIQGADPQRNAEAKKQYYSEFASKACLKTQAERLRWILPLYRRLELKQPTTTTTAEDQLSTALFTTNQQAGRVGTNQAKLPFSHDLGQGDCHICVAKGFPRLFWSSHIAAEHNRAVDFTLDWQPPYEKYKPGSKGPRRSNSTRRKGTKRHEDHNESQSSSKKSKGVSLLAELVKELDSQGFLNKE